MIWSQRNLDEIKRQFDGYRQKVKLSHVYIETATGRKRTIKQIFADYTKGWQGNFCGCCQHQATCTRQVCDFEYKDCNNDCDNCIDGHIKDCCAYLWNIDNHVMYFLDELQKNYIRVIKTAPAQAID